MNRSIAAARNPRTGQLDYEFEVSGPEDVRQAASRARDAQHEWARLGVRGRARELERFAQELSARLDSLQVALETDTGRRRIARQEISGVLAWLKSWPQLAERALISQWTRSATASIRHAPQWRPYPLVAVISPWNFPLLLAMIDAIPALTAGCAVVVKPSEVTPRFVAPLAQAVQASGLLAEVLQLVAGGASTGMALVDVADCVCFTGSVATGQRVAVQAAQRLVPAFLELGGKDPLIVLEGASLESAVTAALRGSVLATGQACQSIERVYVHRSLFGPFVRELVARAAAVRLNWPRIDSGDIGPIIHDRQATVLQEQVQDAVALGAQVLTGGSIEHHGGGLWMRPTVMINVTHQMKVMREETFGPLLPVMSFDTEEQAVAWSNSGIYGLSGAVLGPDLESAERVGRQLEVGAVSLNDAALTALFHEAPKHSFKSSGLGPSRMGPEGLTRFVRRQALIANLDSPQGLDSFAEDCVR